MIILNDWTAFFGRFHPLIVHLPIGFLFVVAGLEILRYFNKIVVSQEILNFIILITAISASLACGAGYLLSLEGGYNEDLLGEHQNQGLWLAAFVWVAWLAKNQYIISKLKILKVLYFPTIIVASLLLIVTGHHGGNLTHGETYLTENTPQPFRTWFGIPDKENKISNTNKPKIANLNEALVYNDIIQPIFKQKCQPCHNATKMKGELRLDTIELLKKGGEHGEIFKVGKSDESELIKRINLSESDDDHMPPKGKIQIDENELALLKWWIDNGATFDKKVAEIPQTESIKPILAALGAGAASVLSQNSVKQDKFLVEEKLLNEKVSELSEGTKKEIEKSGALILPFSQNSNFVEISYVNNSKLTDNEAIMFSKAPDQTLWLRLSNTQITDKSLNEVAKLNKLTRLHLENTKISDAGMPQIKALKNLEYLNLVGTQITDKGLKDLIENKNLKKIYLWQTKITQKGVEELKQALPDLVIDTGISEAQVAEFLKVKPNEVNDDVYAKPKPKVEEKKVKK